MLVIMLQCDLWCDERDALTSGCRTGWSGYIRCRDRLLVSTTRVLGSVVMRPASGAQQLLGKRLEQTRTPPPSSSCLQQSGNIKCGLADLHRAVLRSHVYVAIMVVAKSIGVSNAALRPLGSLHDDQGDYQVVVCTSRRYMIDRIICFMF
jgi:hypothetical protein